VAGGDPICIVYVASINTIYNSLKFKCIGLWSAGFSTEKLAAYSQADYKG